MYFFLPKLLLWLFLSLRCSFLQRWPQRTNLQKRFGNCFNLDAPIDTNYTHICSLKISRPHHWPTSYWAQCKSCDKNDKNGCKKKMLAFITPNLPKCNVIYIQYCISQWINSLMLNMNHYNVIIFYFLFFPLLPSQYFLSFIRAGLVLQVAIWKLPSCHLWKCSLGKSYVVKEARGD